MVNLVYPLQMKSSNEADLRLYAHPLTKELIFYLLDSPQASLKEIRAAFPEVNRKKLDEQIQKLIDCQVIERKERTYSVILPIYTKNQFQADQKLAKEKVAEILSSWKEKMMTEEWEEGLDKNAFSYFIAKVIPQNQELLLLEEGIEMQRWISISSEKAIFASYQSLSVWEQDWVSYFLALHAQCPLVTSYSQKIYPYTGDVETGFFLDRCLRLIRQMDRATGDLEKQKQSVFYQALSAAHWIQNDQLTIRLFRKKLRKQWGLWEEKYQENLKGLQHLFSTSSPMQNYCFVTELYQQLDILPTIESSMVIEK